MKKLLILMMTTLILCGCTNNTQIVENPQDADFTEIETVEVEVSDFVEETQTPVDTTVTEVEKAPTPTTQQPQKPAEEKPADQKVPQTPNQPANKPAKKPQSVKPKEQEKLAQTDEDKISDTPFAVVDLSGKVICIDAGHGAFSQSIDEKIAPDSDTKKPGHTKGTAGTITTEDAVTLAVANVLKTKLEENGATVLMTRTDENATMSNIQRAEYANSNNASIVIKLHADGTKEGGSGMTMLVPGNKYIKDSAMLNNSKKLGRAILKYAVNETGAANRGTYTDNLMSGFNWSKVPVVLFEMGFMTNKDDEAKLNNTDYQNKIAQGILKGIMEYYR